MSYKDSLNLPKTGFPMKANLPNMEPEILKKWDDIDLNKLINDDRKGKESFILHDGPPYANGHIHIGTTFNKILKDFIVKYKNIRGFYSPYVPGWDCHGMPIEHNVTKNLGERAKDYPKFKLRKKCRAYAEKFVNQQKKEFHRLGVHGYWDDPYITMSRVYESTIIENFGKLVEKGYIYRGQRPIHWCPKCSTALAGNEIEYDNRPSPSIFVKLKLSGEDKHILIWTTTPWTLPANVATAMHPREEYAEIETPEGVLILADKLKEEVMKKLGFEEYKVIKKTRPADYEGLEYAHPIFKNKKGRVILADYVTMETGSGIVHIAPGHGYEDYQESLKNDLPLISPVDEEGKFTDYAEKYAGQFVFDANENILKDLKDEGTLLYSGTIDHSYPICWRCKSELIFRATDQWFLSVDHDNLRDKLLKEIDGVRWIPAWSRDRIYNMVEERPDWCLSRQRSWGVPIPALYCRDCGEPHMDIDFIRKITDLVQEHGSDVWFEKEVSELAEGIQCKKCGSSDFRKEEDIFDVWFDSSLSHSAVVKKRENLSWPADLYLEAVDQHRGWFQVSLISATATDGSSPYREVLTHGLILDEKMKKMSKSLGNVVSPEQIWKTSGAEILRLWASSVDYTSDAAFGDDVLDNAKDVYFRIRNSFKFILGNLNDFDYDKHAVDYKDMRGIDRYILHRLAKLQEKIIASYDNYQFHRVFRDFHKFCAVDLSQFYFDILKDRLYTYGKDSRERRSGQTAIYILMDTMLKMIAPILPFTAEQAYDFFGKNNKRDSIHLEMLEEDKEKFINDELAQEWETIKSVREQVNIALEKVRNQGIIGKSLEAELTLEIADREIKDVLEKYEKHLNEIFIVSAVNLEKTGEDFTVRSEDPALRIKAVKSDGSKCARCWIYSQTVGEDEEYPDLCDKCSDVVKSEV
ncbi:MAG: isoleucine--tRNA ligase [bacterium]